MKILDWQELAAVDKMGYLVGSQMAARSLGLVYNFHWVDILEALTKAGTSPQGAKYQLLDYSQDLKGILHLMSFRGVFPSNFSAI